MGPGKHLHGRKLLNGAVDPEEYDYFHEMVVTQELSRSTSRGFQDGNMAGMVISLSAILNFANSEELKQRILDEVLSGTKKICLAITEAFAGSDVAGIQTTATKSKDGSHYIVNGYGFPPSVALTNFRTEQKNGLPTGCGAIILLQVSRQRKASP
jgi:alkylation response protein AidB-like acyl-CoA dehydrogenase